MNREELINRLRSQKRITEGLDRYILDRECFDAFNLPDYRFICVVFELDEGDELYFLDGKTKQCISGVGDEEGLKVKGINKNDKRVKYINFEGN